MKFQPVKVIIPLMVTMLAISCTSKQPSIASGYLKDITLLGSNNTQVRVNQLDNHITGTAGINTVIFTGNSDEYTVHESQGVGTVIDSIAGRDGSNTVKHVERLPFADQTIDLNIET